MNLLSTKITAADKNPAAKLVDWARFCIVNHAKVAAIQTPVIFDQQILRGLLSPALS